MGKKIVYIISLLLFSLSFSNLFFSLGYSQVYGAVFGLLLWVCSLVFLRKEPNWQAYKRYLLCILTVFIFFICYNVWFFRLNTPEILAKDTLFSIFLGLGICGFYVLIDSNIEKKTSQRIPFAFLSLEGPNLFITLLSAVLVNTIFLYILSVFATVDAAQFITNKFLQRGIIPPISTLFFFWGTILLFGKCLFLFFLSRINYNKKYPPNHIITIIEDISHQEDTKKFDHYIELLWKKADDFYLLPRYISWAIPILGFIGTVLGISLSAEKIGELVSSQTSVSQLSTNLGEAIAPLGIAFDTTLIALSLSVVLVLLQTLLQKWEENILISIETHFKK